MSIGLSNLKKTYHSHGKHAYVFKCGWILNGYQEGDVPY